jgi:hypothetical protein
VPPIGPVVQVDDGLDAVLHIQAVLWTCRTSVRIISSVTHSLVVLHTFFSRFTTSTVKVFAGDPQPIFPSGFKYDLDFLKINYFCRRSYSSVIGGHGPLQTFINY